MLQEKILAARCRKLVIIVDESKVKDSLDGLTIPVEVIPEAASIAEAGFSRLGASVVKLRAAGTGKHGPVITEKGNLVYDVQFSKVDAELEDRIKGLVGVVESGLFTRYVSEVLIAGHAGLRTLKKAS